MFNATLWWVDKTKQLHKYALTDTLPPQIQKQGRLYLAVEDPKILGTYTVYNLSAFPNINLSTITSTDGLGVGYIFRPGDMSYVKTYDALRRTGWSIDHSNVQTRVRGDKLYESVDPDLVITQTEIKDLTNILCFVNGAYHRSAVDPNTNDLYIYDGCQTLRNERSHADVTVVDYKDVGGMSVYPLQSFMFVITDTLPRGIVVDISKATGYKGETLRDYYVQVIVDGTLYSAGSVSTATGDTTFSITISKLNLLRNFLKSPILRKDPLPLPVLDGIRPFSNSHDKALDTFTRTQTVPNGSFMTNDWILQRLTSQHSAVILVPKTVVCTETSLQNETNEAWWKVLPTKASRMNSILTIDAKRFSPLYIHTKGYRNRTLMPLPYHESREPYSINDPLGRVVASPDRDIRNDKRVIPYTKLTQWFTLPVLGEFK